MTDTFWPKQIIRVTPETIKEVTRDGGEKLAIASLKQISIPAGSVIHDNGCGNGAVTAMIMDSVSPEVAASITIKGTDIDEEAVEAYNIRSKGWPAEGMVMDANEVKFPDQTFTHSIGNAMIFLTGNNGIDTIREMHRTLKPGGTLVVNCFGYTPHLGAVREASRRTRAGILPEWDSFENWEDPKIIAGIVKEGGFSTVDVQQREVFTNVGDFDRHVLLSWSFRGMPSTGWSEQDEEKWDEAIEILKEELQKSDNFEILDDGSGLRRAVINVATATK